VVNQSSSEEKERMSKWRRKILGEDTSRGWAVWEGPTGSVSQARPRPCDRDASDNARPEGRKRCSLRLRSIIFPNIKAQNLKYRCVSITFKCLLEFSSSLRRYRDPCNRLSWPPALLNCPCPLEAAHAAVDRPAPLLQSHESESREELL
jgi:hypothetical protein